GLIFMSAWMLYHWRGISPAGSKIAFGFILFPPYQKIMPCLKKQQSPLNSQRAQISGFIQITNGTPQSPLSGPTPVRIGCRTGNRKILLEVRLDFCILHSSY
ncbi:MAG: hypothetical protein Q8N95_01925, partial [Desulfobacterales bacterium]|nr:hypothetical protein [Desulfobacterales bacterium]